MKITLDRVNDAVHLVGKNEAGNVVDIDGSVSIGGEGLGASPMQLVLMALGGCSSMDVLSILKKMKQNVKSYHVEINGERAVDAIPAVFTDIHIQFIFEGDLDSDKIEKAIQLSMDKYCSVTKMLETTVNITHSFEVKI
jgi:putative redox protein